MTPLLAPTLSVASARYQLRLARDAHDLDAAQHLRYQVFNLELGEGLAESREAQRDADLFDTVCDHLLVTETESGNVVGTYRLQTGAVARAHFGYYSEQEFNLTPFEPRRGEIIELGRACVHRDHRNQSVIGMLWRGIALYAHGRGARYLIGCSSLSSVDPAVGLLAYRQLMPRHAAPLDWLTRPQPGFECRPANLPEPIPVAIPRLMAAYLALGATLCGEPALDREFGTIDFLTLLDLQAMPMRVWNKYLRTAPPTPEPAA